MDKKVILAVAGSGKTTILIGRLNEDSRALIVTYTNNNINHIKGSILKKFGYHPANIIVMSYFSFAYRFLLKPFLGRAMGLRGIDYQPAPRFAVGEDRFINKNDQIYANRIAARLCQDDVKGDVVDRIERYFDILMIDEVQDLGGNDFNLLNVISKADVEQLLVGDFYQHTFDTSRDGNVNKNLHSSLDRFTSRLSQLGFAVDRQSLGASHRCSPDVCNFISDKLGIEINSSRQDRTKIQLIEDADNIESIFNADRIPKLFYSNSAKYGCYALNWGASKGQDHHSDVCIVMNKNTFKAYADGLLHTLEPGTRNKLYVALTRARGDVFIVSEAEIKHKQR